MADQYLVPATHSVPSSQLYADKGSVLIGVASSLAALCIIAVTARFVALKKGKIAVWWDDWLCIPSLIFALGLAAIDIAMVQVAGVGRHLESFGAETIETEVSYLKLLYAELLVYSFAIPLPRLAILFLYIRIFSKGCRTFRLILYGVAILMAVWCPIVFFLELFSCSPIAFIWDKSIEGGTCIFVVKTFCRFIAIPIVFYDIALLVLPLPIIWHLQTTIKQKIALSSVFIIGSVGLVASILRLLVVLRPGAFADTTWKSVELLGWTMVEADAALIAACIPRLKPLVKWFGELASGIRSKMTPSVKNSISRSSDDRRSNNQEWVQMRCQGLSLKRQRSEGSSVDNSLLLGRHSAIEVA